MSSSVIVALDFESETEALALVSRLGQDATCYKVGLQLLIEAGPSLIRHLVSIGKQVVLDLKLHEIPHSVAAGVKAAGKLGAAMVTVHASGGSEVLRAAVAAAKPFAGLQVLALTVVTSLTDKELPEIGLAPSVQAQVERLARLSAACGCHGVVASAHEAAFLRGFLPFGSLIVTPGIHLPGASANDQARGATPQVAALAGATHIVIGRGITGSSNPAAAFAAAVGAFHHVA